MDVVDFQTHSYGLLKLKVKNSNSISYFCKLFVPITKEVKESHKFFTHEASLYQTYGSNGHISAFRKSIQNKKYIKIKNNKNKNIERFFVPKTFQ